MTRSLRAALTGLAGGILFNAMALCLHAGRVFRVYMVLEVMLLGQRIVVMVQCARHMRHGQAINPELYFLIAMSWCA